MNTKDIILKNSKEEFISKGYNDASLRSIALKCHISATAIYRHFKNKEELFNAVIDPFIKDFNQTALYIENKDNEYLKNANINQMWNFEHDGSFQYNLLFGKNNDLVKLIVNERKSWFKDFVVNYEFEATLKYIDLMKKEGYLIKDFNAISFRLLLDSYLESYLYLLDKNIDDDKLKIICSDINEFYTLGFRNLLGF